jgi:hypothetical protein
MIHPVLMHGMHEHAEDFAYLEDLMEFPPCPVCKEGHLLPFSDDKKPFTFWMCSTPTCGYTISRHATGVAYYKGAAAAQEKAKGEKKWIQYDF